MARKKSPRKTQEQETGERIRRRREELGLSRADLAAMVRTRDGKPQSYSKIAQWEEGQNMPTKARRPELADALQTTTLALFGEIAEPVSLKRLDLVEKKVDAIILIQGLGDAVEARLRSDRQADRRSAQETAEGLRSLQKERAPQGKRRATPKKAAGG